MALEEFIAQHGRIDRPAGDFAFKHIAHGEEIALAFGHFFAFDEQEARVHPEAGEVRFTGGAAGLCDFAFVMGEDVVFAAGVNIDDIFAQHRAGHGGAFDVPAGVTIAPRAGPFHQVFRVRLPEQKIGRVFFCCHRLHSDAAAFAGLELHEGVARELAVGGKGFDIVINRTIGADVSVAGGDEFFDHRDHAGDDMIGGVRHMRLGGIAVVLECNFHIEQLCITDEGIGVEAGDLIGIIRVADGRQMGGSAFLGVLEALGGGFHFVHAAAVSQIIFCHVAHVGDVHHLMDVVAGEFEKSAKDIREDEGAEVADVSEVVNRRPAVVHVNIRRADGGEGFKAMGERVVKADFHGQKV